MRRVEIKRMWFDVTGNAPVTIEMVQTFAALVAAAEREACAVIAEQNAPDDGGLWIGNVIAAAIRERSRL